MRRLAVVATAALVVVSSCSGGGGGDKSTELTMDEQVDYFLGIGSVDLVKRVETRVATRRGDLVRSCMSDAGFEFVPPDPRSTFAVTPLLTMSKADFAAQYGLGVIAFMGPNAASFDSGLNAADDPNEAVLSSLSASGREAWFDAQARCEEGAEREATLVEDLAGITAAVADFNAEVRADDRVVAATKSWSECMSRSGFSYPDREAMLAAARARAEELLANGAAEEGAPNHGEWHDQEHREIEVAVADVKCRKDLDTVVRDVTLDLRGEFLQMYVADFARPEAK